MSFFPSTIDIPMKWSACRCLICDSPDWQQKGQILRIWIPPSNRSCLLIVCYAMYTSARCHFVPCVPNFFQETYTECIQGMEAIPITDEEGKGKRRKKEPATQESSWNSPQLPNMTKESQRWEGDSKPVLFSAISLLTETSPGERDLARAEGLRAKGSSLWSLLL